MSGPRTVFFALLLLLGLACPQSGVSAGDVGPPRGAQAGPALLSWIPSNLGGDHGRQLSSTAACLEAAAAETAEVEEERLPHAALLASGFTLASPLARSSGLFAAAPGQSATFLGRVARAPPVLG